MYIDHAGMYVRVSVCPSRWPTLLHVPGCTWGMVGAYRRYPLVVHYWADLQSVHGCCCYDNIAPYAKCQRVSVLALCLVAIITGSLVAIRLLLPAKFAQRICRPYITLGGGDFEVLCCRVDALHRCGWQLAWRRSPKFTPIGPEMGAWAPKTKYFTEFLNIIAPQGRICCANFYEIFQNFWAVTQRVNRLDLGDSLEGGYGVTGV